MQTHPLAGAARVWAECPEAAKAMRLKPHAIDIRVSVDPVHYFLNERNDTRSSFYLEDAATEFQVQGLELDWICVTWDGDFRFNGSGWDHHDFRGNRWCNINNFANRNYLRNAYRVLLTRARQGMVVFDRAILARIGCLRICRKAFHDLASS